MYRESTFNGGAGFASVALLAIAAIWLAGCDQPEASWMADPYRSFSARLATDPPPLCVEHGAWPPKAPVTQTDEALVTKVRRGVLRSLYYRPDWICFRRLCRAVDTIGEARRWAVLELSEWQSHGWVLLAETRAGWRGLTNLRPWHAEDAWYTYTGPVRRLRIDKAKAEAWFEQVKSLDLAERTFVDEHWTHEMVRLQASALQPSGIVLAGPEAWDVVQGLRPLGKTASEGQVQTWLNPPGDLPARLPDVVMHPANADRYAKARNAYIALPAELYEIAVGWPRLADVGGISGAIRRARGGGGTGGPYCGEEGRPGPFFRLGLAVSRDASHADLLRMLAHRDLPVRMMAMSCLAQSDAPGRAEAIAGQLGGRKTWETFQGCMTSWESETRFARNLLHNANYHSRTLEAAPMLPPDKLLAIDLRLMADDAQVNAHEDAGQGVRAAIVDGRLALTVPAVRAAAMGLSAVDAVKALARAALFDFGPNSEWDPAGAARTDKFRRRTRRVILDVMSDEAAPPLARLAAASALGAEGDPAGLKALAAAEAELNAIADGKPVTAILKSVELARQLDKRTDGMVSAFLRPKPADNDNLKAAPEFLNVPPKLLIDELHTDYWYVRDLHNTATRSPGPAGGGGLFSGGGLFDEKAPPGPKLIAAAKKAFADALIRVAEADLRPNRPWSLDASAAYAFEHFLADDPDGLIDLVGKRAHAKALKLLRAQLDGEPLP